MWFGRGERKIVLAAPKSRDRQGVFVGPSVASLPTVHKDNAIHAWSLVLRHNLVLGCQFSFRVARSKALRSGLNWFGWHVPEPEAMGVALYLGIPTKHWMIADAATPFQARETRQIRDVPPRIQ
jgi:hypothetical protein